MENDMKVVQSHAPRHAGLRRRGVLALPGSLRRGSFNRMLLQAARECAPAGMDIEVFGSPESIPLFNEDLEVAGVHGLEPVHRLRQLIEASDGFIIATPEYNQSMPGVLKNIIDWLSRPGSGEVLAGKPVVVMGATSGTWGTRLAQHALRQTLAAVGARVMPEPALHVRDAARLFDEHGMLVDSATRVQLVRLMTAFDAWVQLLASDGR